MYFWLHDTPQCAEQIVCAWVLHQLKGWDRGSGWGHPQGAVYMAAARFGCKRTMLALGRLILGSKIRLRKHYSHLVRDSILAA